MSILNIDEQVKIWLITAIMDTVIILQIVYARVIVMICS